MNDPGLRARAPLAAMLLLVGCSSVAADAPVPLGKGGSSSGEADGETAGDDDDNADGAATTSAGGDESTGGGADSSSGDPPPPSAGYPHCPEPLPPSWVLCEDFEDVDDLSKVYFEYQDGDGAFTIGEGDAASGERSMRTRYRKGVEGAGWLSAAIGRNPAVYGETPNPAADTDFQAIYWRFRIKTQAGWPDVGMGHVTSASVFASSEWTQAMVARLRSEDDNVVLRADPISCVVDDAVACDGFEDPIGQKGLGGLVGATPIFSSADADQWHCVEAHVVLNTPGEHDGVFEFWVDDALENGAYSLDWRGTWSEFGINLVTLENLWPGGAPDDLERAIDDFVISTEPIGCE